MYKRTLTGNWYLKRKWFNRFKVMVEVTIEEWKYSNYDHDGGDDFLNYTIYEEAEDKDLVALNINIV